MVGGECGMNCEIKICDDISIAIGIIYDAAAWLSEKGETLWLPDEITPEEIKKRYAENDFAIAYVDKKPVGCVALVDHMPFYWPSVPAEKSLFLHKLSVIKGFHGHGIGDALMNYAQQKAKKRGYEALRLDCDIRPKLCAYYEKHGYIKEGEKVFANGIYHIALYVKVLQDENLPMTEQLKNQLQFLMEADKMKSVYRQTLLIDKSREETDAEHSWHFALMAMTLYPYAADKSVNLDRVIKMALVHDLVEVYAGDTFAYDAVGYEDKEERGKAAADRLFGLLPAEQGNEYRSLWEEFDEMKTPDALYASAIDRLQPFINNIKTHGHTWVQHGVTVDKVYKRMSPVREALPELWSFVDDAINDALEKGYIKQTEKARTDK
jgi:putative hydrolase of HD superfamily